MSRSIPRTVETAGERVWARLTNEVRAAADSSRVSGEPAPSESHRILGCEGFRELMPAYLVGALAEPKRVLLEDHTRECLPCRRALAAARQAKAAVRPAAAGEPARARRGHRAGFGSGTRRWALAAGLAGVALLSGFLVRQAGVGYLGAAPSVTVRSISGELAVVAGGEVRPAVAGERIAGSQLVRTAQGSGAVLELADGSQIELAERSELGLGRRWDGTMLELERGSLIVEAAEQRRGHLYVDTGDCRVSVVGTIFSVNHGAKGSRVSVIEGEVHVRQGAELAVLLPGQQLATGHRLAAVPLAEEISWSRDAARYRERLAASEESRSRARPRARAGVGAHLDAPARSRAGGHRRLRRPAQPLAVARARPGSSCSSGWRRIRSSASGGASTSPTPPTRPRSRRRSPSSSASAASSGRRSSSRSTSRDRGKPATRSARERPRPALRGRRIRRASRRCSTKRSRA